MSELPGAEDAAWQDLVARLGQPLPDDPAAAPWPARENITLAERGGRADERTRVIRPAGLAPRPADRFRAETAAESAGDDTGPRPGAAEPERDARPPGAQSDAAAAEDDWYLPPPAPPLPKLSPVAKGAWLALLGGPGYLFAATLLGWQVPSWAALAAIAAFVAGFTLLVLRLSDGPSRRDDPDQGAVV